MTFYISIITIAAFVIMFFNSIFFKTALNVSSLGAIGLVLLAVAVSFALDALCAFIVRQVKAKHFNPFGKFFKERGNERAFYEKLHIRKWKDIIPELGKTLKYFDKSNIPDKPNSDYMMTFLKETCYAEIMHFSSICVAPLVLVIMPLKFILAISLPVMLVNICLNVLPIMVQRYTRPRLAIAYTRLKRSEENAQPVE